MAGVLPTPHASFFHDRDSGLVHASDEGGWLNGDHAQPPVGNISLPQSGPQRAAPPLTPAERAWVAARITEYKAAGYTKEVATLEANSDVRDFECVYDPATRLTLLQSSHGGNLTLQAAELAVKFGSRGMGIMRRPAPPIQRIAHLAPAA